MTQLANLTTTLAIESASFVNGIEQSRGAVRRLVASLDPAAAAQAKFNRQMDLAERGLKSGQLSADLYEKVVARLRQRLDEATESGGKLTRTSGMMRSGMQQLGFQLGDISQGFAMGTSAATIFAQQSGQVIQSLQLMTTETRGFLAFMAGPWGAILSAALVAATPFVAKIFEGGDALDKETDKLKKEAEQSRVADQAKEAFGNTLEGVTQAINDQRKALDQLANADKTAAEQADENAKANLKKALAVRQATAAAAEQAAVLAENARSQNIFAGGPGGAQSLVSAQYATAAERAAATAKDAIAKVVTAQRQLAEADYDLGVENAKRMADQVQVITKKYNDQIAAIQSADRALIQAGQHARADSAARITALEKEKKAAIEAYEAANRASNDNRQTGRQISLPEAEAIVKSIGGTITSATRSFAQQSALYAKYLAGTGSLAAKPGHSDHELGNALDIAKTPGMSLAKIREAFTEAGVSIKQLLDEGNHFHVAWKEDSKAAAQASRDEAAAIKMIRDAATGAYKALAGLDRDQHKAVMAGFADAAKDWDETAKQAATAFKAGQDQRLFDEHQLQRVREDNIRDLAGLYSDLFTGGTKRLWQDFQRWGFDVISQLLAKWTVGAAAGGNGGGGLGGLLGGIGKILGLAGGGPTVDVGAINAGTNALLDTGLPGLATGGDIRFGGKSGIDNNILSLNGSPIAKVSRGETASIRNGRAANDQPIVIHIVGEEGAAFVPRVTAISGVTSAQVLQGAQQAQVKRADRRLGR